MRKKLIGIVAVILTAVTLGFASPAQAVSYTCFRYHPSLSISGSTAAADVYVDRDFDSTTRVVRRAVYNTSPGIQVDRVTISYGDTSNMGVVYIKGGNSSTHNDVPTKWTATGINYPLQNGNAAKMTVYDSPNGNKSNTYSGGVNLGGASCASLGFS